MRAAGMPQTGIVGAPVGPTAIVAALPEEIAPCASLMTVSSRVRLDGRRVLCGRIGRAPVVLAAIGDGRVSAARGLARLLDAVPAGRVLAIGVAGGLTPDLGPGSLVVAARLLDGDRPPLRPDAVWLGRAARLGGAVVGVSVTTDRILVRASDKSSVARDLGLVGAATVDLESAALAGVAARRGVPFLSVRAVSDAAWEDLPLDFDALRRPDGGVSRPRVVVRALAHPSTIPGLVRLGRRVRSCADRLAMFVAQLLDGGPS